MTKKKSKTAKFGSGNRQSHDSSSFYRGKLYDGFQEDKAIEYQENSIPEHILNCIFEKSSETMDEIPNNSVHLMITSPPYNVQKLYDENLDLNEYLNLLERVFREAFRVLVPGGRACINIANLGRKPYIPLNGYIAQIMNELGFMMRGEIIWDKAVSAGRSTAWGSWLSAANPSFRDVHEYILIFSKQRYGREKVASKESTITKDEFLEYTKSIWSFPTVSAKKIGHPAPFPEELPYRLIQLLTYKDEIVLDPFIGSGTTAVASVKTKRKYIGYELDPMYIKIADRRIEEAYNHQLKLI